MKDSYLYVKKVFVIAVSLLHLGRPAQKDVEETVQFKYNLSDVPLCQSVFAWNKLHLQELDLDVVEM